MMSVHHQIFVFFRVIKQNNGVFRRSASASAAGFRAKNDRGRNVFRDFRIDFFLTRINLVADAGTEVQILDLSFAPELVLDNGLEQTKLRGRVDLGHLDARNTEVLLTRLGVGRTIIHEGLL